MTPPRVASEGGLPKPAKSNEFQNNPCHHNALAHALIDFFASRFRPISTKIVHCNQWRLAQTVLTTASEPRPHEPPSSRRIGIRPGSLPGLLMSSDPPHERLSVDRRAHIKSLRIVAPEPR